MDPVNIKRPSRSKTRDLRLTTLLRAKPENVYRALTSARELCRWWLAGAETDARNTGRFRMVWPKARRGGDLPRALGEKEGYFVDLEPGKKVAWMWKTSARNGAPPLSSFFIEAKARGCEVTLLHSGFSAKAAADRSFQAYAQGWEDCLAKLKLYVESGRAAKTETLSLASLKTFLKVKK